MSDCKAEDDIGQYQMNSFTTDIKAMDRVTEIPMVANTINAASSYYSKAKESYPSVTPYLEMAEKMTKAAAAVAMTTAKPVVDKLGPSVNNYANIGLDKLESVVPMINEEPDEIYNATKNAVSAIINRKIDSVVSTTEDYVDYYLPSTEEPMEYTQYDNDNGSNTDSESDESVDEPPTVVESVEKLKVISLKVRERAYKRAIRKIGSIKQRSDQTMQRLNFTVDLIQYAKQNMETTKEKVTSGLTSANENIRTKVDGTQQTVVSVWETLKERTNQTTAEMKVLERAQSLSRNLQENCLAIANSLQGNQEYLRSQALRAKDIATNVMTTLADKTSLRELSSSITNTVHVEILAVQQLVEGILDRMAEKNMFDWIVSIRTSRSTSAKGVEILEAE